jgi:hypothetical protein
MIIASGGTKSRIMPATKSQGRCQRLNEELAWSNDMI